MNVSKAKELIAKYNAGLCTPEEKDILFSWYIQQQPKEHELLSTTERMESMQKIRKRLLNDIRKNTYTKIKPVWYRISAAACIIVAIAVGAYIAFYTKPKQQLAIIKPGVFKNEVRAGNKAILTLSNGQQLALSNIPTGPITKTNLIKTRQGALIYNANKAIPEGFNTLTVPNGGGKHELKLPDGTLAVLDAGSSIKFPVAFHGRDRHVSITGQVYFEVKHNASKPFYVTVGKETIEDLGTRFNINAFDDQVQTTLLEGSITVNHILLKPGQQVVNSSDGKSKYFDHIDEESVIAWKSGLFRFDHTDLRNVMNQLARWYNVDVVYKGPDKPYHFGGYLSRESDLTSVLKILQLNGVKFSLEGRRLTVYR